MLACEGNTDLANVNNQHELCRPVTSPTWKKGLESCHSDPTSGHLGMKKTLARVTARFIWHGIVKDVNTFVSISPSMKVL